MFFLITSAFWLALVFYCMNWPGGERPEILARQAAGGAVQRAQTAALDAAVSACKADLAGCLSLASNATHGHAASPRPALRGTIAE